MRVWRLGLLAPHPSAHLSLVLHTEVSTTLNDNPRSRESRPPWIHLVPMPNPYRGKWRYGPASDAASPVGGKLPPSEDRAADDEAVGRRYADDEAVGRRYADAVRAVCSRLSEPSRDSGAAAAAAGGRRAEDLDGHLGGGPAAFIAEPLSGNAGGVELPPGFLREAYAAVSVCVDDTSTPFSGWAKDLIRALIRRRQQPVEAMHTLPHT